MNSEIGLQDIAYFEYKVINELVHAHVDEFGKRLRAIIAFGPLKISGGTFDIDLLEVVDGWRGLDKQTFQSTAEFPMRGTLTLDFLSSARFEKAGGAEYLNNYEQDRQLIERVRQGFEIVYETPAGYARDILSQAPKEDFAARHLRDPRKPLAEIEG